MTTSKVTQSDRLVACVCVICFLVYDVFIGLSHCAFPLVPVQHYCAPHKHAVGRSAIRLCVRSFLGWTCARECGGKHSPHVRFGIVVSLRLLSCFVSIDTLSGLFSVLRPKECRGPSTTFGGSVAIAAPTCRPIWSWAP